MDGLRTRYTFAANSTADLPAHSSFGYLYDLSGNVSQRLEFYETGQNGLFVGARDYSVYDAFGLLEGHFDAVAVPPGTGTDLASVGFGGQAGYYTDQETGLVLLGARYYDPSTGRFLNRDPMGYGGGINLYGFCGNNPVNEADPNGTSAAAAISSGLDAALRIFPAASQAVARGGLGSVVEAVAPRANILIGGAVAGYELYQYAKTGHPAGLLTSIGDYAGRKIGTFLYPTTSYSSPIILAKRGPKTGGAGPHNATIDRRIGEIKAQNPAWTHTGGGSLTEEYIKTPAGSKSARRPDITFELPNGTNYREQVGKRTATGSPVQREIDAMDDIQQQTGQRPHFTPYN